MDTQNNIEQAIDQKISELMELIEETGGSAIVIAHHPDLGFVRSSLYGKVARLIEIVLSLAKANKDFLNILKAVLRLMKDDQATEAPEAEVLPSTTLPS